MGSTLIGQPFDDPKYFWGRPSATIMRWHKPGEGPPDHVHLNKEEVFFIVDGTYELI